MLQESCLVHNLYSLLDWLKGDHFFEVVNHYNENVKSMGFFKLLIQITHLLIKLVTSHHNGQALWPFTGVVFILLACLLSAFI